MAITRNTYVERVLITLNQDGSVRAAHQESISVLTEDGEVLSTRQEIAVPLAPETLATLLPDQAALLAQISALQAAQNQPASPPAGRSIAPLAFRRRLGQTAMAAITAAAMANPAIRVMLDDLAASQVVNLDDPEVVAGLDTLVAAGLIDGADKTRALA